MSEQLDGDATNEGTEGQDNELIKSLRTQLKDANAAKKAAEAQAEEALVKAREQLSREATAQRLVDTAGYPGLKDVVLNQVEGEILPEAVIKTLQSLQLQVDENAFKTAVETGTTSPTPPQTQAAPQATAQALADVQSLGGRLAAATQTEPASDFMAEIEKATSLSEVEALAEKYGFNDPS